MNIIIVEKSRKQELDSPHEGFISRIIKEQRIIRTDKVIDILTMDDVNFGIDDTSELYKSFFIKYDCEYTSKGIKYIFCYGDFRIFNKLLLTGGEFKS